VNIFFDVDETILGYDGSLRPLVADVFGRLVGEGHLVYVWSGVRSGDIIRSEVVERYGLSAFVTDCFRKPLFDYAEQWRKTGISVQPDFCVDDYPDIVEAFGGYMVIPYRYARADSEMELVYNAIQTAVHRT
jgi:FMN phosphatase YigB (HAD superfamily)